MTNVSSKQFELIVKMIAYAYEHRSEQPDLTQIASVVGLSPSYAQKMFKDWVGLSPKNFLQYMSVQHAKEQLEQQHTLLHTSLETGLSSMGRLHDLFIKIEAMTPGDYKKQAKNLILCYGFYDTIFGEIFIVSTEKGICSLQFVLNDAHKNQLLSELEQQYNQAEILKKSMPIHLTVCDWLKHSVEPKLKAKIPLALSGTNFQIKVWEALLRIPEGHFVSYQQLAEQIGQPTAVRAVASAVAKNPIAYLIPCHRVIRSSGIIGEYRWESGRKVALLAYEKISNSVEAI